MRGGDAGEEWPSTKILETDRFFNDAILALKEQAGCGLHRHGAFIFGAQSNSSNLGLNTKTKRGDTTLGYWTLGEEF